MLKIACGSIKGSVLDLDTRSAAGHSPVMACKLRGEYSDAIYHGINRGKCSERANALSCQFLAILGQTGWKD
jgi:hypothetical protein